MRVKFNSIANSGHYGYAYDSEVWESRSNPFLSIKFRMFETYGDGLTQHSPDWAVTEDFATDYLFSLAAAMIENPEITNDAVYRFNEKPRPDLLAFAASLIYNPEKDSGYGKTRYYSTNLMKVTRNREKAHDDRYKELRDWHTGTPDAIYKMIVPEYSDGLTRWLYANAIREWAGENLKNSFMEMPAVFLEWFKDRSESQHEQYNKARDFRDAVEACQSITESYRLHKTAVQEVENYRDASKRKAEREAAKAAEIATNETVETV